MKIIKFGAEWCSACKSMDKIYYEELKNWECVDVDDQPELITKYGINKLPTLLFLNNEDIEVNRHVGAMTTEQYNSYLNG